MRKARQKSKIKIQDKHDFEQCRALQNSQFNAFYLIMDGFQ